MARRVRGRAWGNALGGWRKQSRKANGQFGSGGSRAKAKRAAPKRRKAAPKKKPVRRTTPKKKLTQAELKARRRRNRNIAIGVGVVVGAAMIADNRYQMQKIAASGIGAYKDSYTTPSGVKISTSNSVSPLTIMLSDRGNLKFSHRPMVNTTSYAYRSGQFEDTLLGYRTVTTRGNTAKFDNIYVHKDGRGQGLAKEMTDASRKAVAGKKVRVSGFRSDAGDALSKKLFEPHEIPKRYKPNSKKVKNITSNMNRTWKTTEHQWLREMLAESMRKGK